MLGLTNKRVAQPTEKNDEITPKHFNRRNTKKNATKRRVSGEFVRGVSGFRHAIGDPDFQPEKIDTTYLLRSIVRGAIVSASLAIFLVST